MKTRFFDKKIIKQFGIHISWISIIVSLVFIFIELSECTKIIVGVFFLVLIVAYYICLFVIANTLSQRELQINNSTVVVKTGDIFEQDGFKVIAFNEYFDTLVDDVIIAKSSINGQFINKKVKNLSALDKDIEGDSLLKEKQEESNTNRRNGKSQKYQLGSIFVYKEEYLLTAFSHFDDDNKAYLTMVDYLQFLMSFWSEIDRVYAGKSISIPLLGSGITRFKGYENADDMELLNILIWSFKISRIKFTYPAKVTIIINKAKKNKINFYKILEG